MSSTRAAALLWISLAALPLGCKPHANGRCTANEQCRAGSSCNLDLQLCLADTTPCTPACGPGNSCLAGACIPAVPTVSITGGSNPILSPSKNTVSVHIDTDPALTLGVLTVEASTSALVAQGTLPAAIAGDQLVTLTRFDAGAEGAGTLLARLAYKTPDGADHEVRSVSVPAQLDSAGPLVALTTLDASDSVGGWFPRTAGNITVMAKLTDAGSGPQAAVLEFVTCPAGAGVACTYTGVLEGAIAGGVGSYKFAVPRFAQAQRTESALPFIVLATDAGGNQTAAPGTLSIDDKPPAVSPTAQLITTGQTGEDGHSWFPAGARGALVELSFGVSDSGVGFSITDAVLMLATADIDSGEDTSVAGVFPTPPDGTVRFHIPTSRISHREGAVHYSVVVRDKLKHTTTVAQSDENVIWVDDVPPLVTVAVPDYAGAFPELAVVCPAFALATPEPLTSFVCGRAPGGAVDRVLRDDQINITFDLWDCGVGIAGAASVIAETGGQTLTTALNSHDNEWGTNDSVCTNGNLKHTYGFSLGVGDFTVSDAPDSLGSFRVRLRQSVQDRLGLSTASVSTAAGDGTVLVSQWRWKRKLEGLASGDPALIDAALGDGLQEGRSVVIPMDSSGVPATGHAVAILGPDGSVRAQLALADSVSSGTARSDFPTGEIAVGDANTLWVPGSTYSCNGGLSSCSRVWRIPTPLAASPVPSLCGQMVGAVGGLALRTAVADSGNTEAAVVALGTGAGADVAYTFTADTNGSCKTIDHQGFLLHTALNGVSLADNAAQSGGVGLFSDSQGFLSVVLDAAGQLNSSFVSMVDTSGAPLTLAQAPAPLFSSGGDLTPVFNAGQSGSNHRLRKAAYGTCALGADCWQPAATPWADGAHAAIAQHTPVFDAANVYTVDTTGTLDAFDKTSGASAIPAPGTIPAVDASDTSVTTAQLVSPPLILQGTAPDNPLVLVQANGLVRVVHPTTKAAAVMLRVGPFPLGKTPVTPVADTAEGRSTIYLIDGGCDRGQPWTSGGGCTPSTTGSWAWALQIDAPPLTADHDDWPRPARDSCNTRHAEASCP